MNKTLIKLMCLILVVLTVAAAFAACTEPGETEQTSGEMTDSKTESPAITFVQDDLPDEEIKAEFMNQPVKILYWEDVERIEFEVEELAGSAIPDAIFKRNKNVQERTGVQFEWDCTPGDNGEKDKFVKYVENQANGGNYYDIIATYSRTMSILTNKNYMKDLNAISDSYLNFDKPWWPETAINEFTIDDKIYFVTGDCSTNSLHFMYVVYYNTEMFGDYYPDDADPTQLVLDQAWTLDELIKYSTGMGNDVGGDGKDTTDTFGLVTIDYHCDALYTGSGLKLIDQGGDNLIFLSDDYSSEKTIKLVEKMGRFFASEDGWVNSKYKTPFAEGNALFALDRAYLVDPENGSGINQSDLQYGVLPVPKWDKAQDDYITCMGNPVTLYGTMVGSGVSNEDNYTRNTAVLECWASEAYRNTTVAVFEITMKSQYAANNIYANMYQIIKENISFDLGRVFAGVIGNISENPSKAIAAAKEWSTGGTTLNIPKAKIKELGKSLAKVN